MPEAVPAVPEDWRGSEPEWFIYWALVRLGYKPNDDFIYQSAYMGGRTEYGGAVLDFVLPNFGIAINVQSTYYHYLQVRDRVHDAIIREQVEGMGIRLMYIDEEDARANPLYYTREALAGHDHSKLGGA